MIAPSDLFLHQHTAENHLWKVDYQVGLKIFKLFTVRLDFFVFFVFRPIWFKEIKGPELILPNLLDRCGRTFSNSVLISLRSFLASKTPCSTCFKPLSSQRGTKMVKVEKSSAKPGEIKLDKKWTLNSFFFLEGGGGYYFFYNIVLTIVRSNNHNLGSGNLNLQLNEEKKRRQSKYC